MSQGGVSAKPGPEETQRLRKRWWSPVGEGRVCPDGSIASAKAWRGTGALSRHHRLYLLCGSELRPQAESKQATARPCSEGRGLTPGCENIVFPSDCLGQMQPRQEQETVKVWPVPSCRLNSGLSPLSTSFAGDACHPERLWTI